MKKVRGESKVALGFLFNLQPPPPPPPTFVDKVSGGVMFFGWWFWWLWLIGFPVRWIQSLLEWMGCAPASLKAWLFFGVSLPLSLLLARTCARGSLREWIAKKHQKRWAARLEKLHQGLCPTCGYNLTGLTDPRCPECGDRFDG